VEQYLKMCKHILENGVVKQDRTGTGTISVFGYQMRFDLSKGFPLMTTKDMGGVRLKGIIAELLWFLDGDTDVSTLINQGVNIWTPDAYRWYREKGGELPRDAFVSHVKNAGFDLGPIYARQWRDWTVDRIGYNKNSDSEYLYTDHFDQLKTVIEEIKNNPDSRRLIVSAWNVGQIEEMALPPCHVLFQFYVANGKLSCQLYQRSGDVFLGVPYNIASYSLLTHMIAQQTGLEVGEFVHTLGDAHIYLNHVEQVKLQLTREPRELPKLIIKRKPESIFEYKHDDFEFVGYNPHPSIKGDVSF
jgi:thymidylate synthase